MLKPPRVNCQVKLYKKEMDPGYEFVIFFYRTIHQIENSGEAFIFLVLPDLIDSDEL